MSKPTTDTAPDVEPQRVIADLRELATLTADATGARRLAWSKGWIRAREWLVMKLRELPVRVQRDPAGNLLADLDGQSSAFLAVGSHLDSVPSGGWLDGALGVLAGLELLRAYAQELQPPPLGLRLIDWADEEGARFGHSLFGSSAAAGALDPVDLAELRDRDGITLADAMRACRVDIATAARARQSLDQVEGYLELHIEQGPVLERRGRRAGVVTGTVGVERRLLHLAGEAAHAGAAPMEMRRDPLVAAARAIAESTDLAVALGATATFGAITVRPGIVTIVPNRCDVVIDLRHADGQTLSRLVADVDLAVVEVCSASRVQAQWESQWRIEPIPFDQDLIELAKESCSELGIEPLVMPSGALHDAAVVARRLPVVMLFTPSRRGISHSPVEDTDIADLTVGVRALAALAHRALLRFSGKASSRVKH